MSAENVHDPSKVADPDPVRQDTSTLDNLDLLNNNSIVGGGNMSYTYIPEKVSYGDGDVPELISNETPPTAILEMNSDHELIVAAAGAIKSNAEISSSTASEKGEGTEVALNNANSASKLLVSSVKETQTQAYVTAKNEGMLSPSSSSKSTVPEEGKTEDKLLANHTYDLSQPFDLLSSKVSASTSTVSKNEDSSNLPETGEPTADTTTTSVPKTVDKANFSEDIILKASDTLIETIDTSTSAPPLEPTSSSLESREESRAVNAPEAEHEKDKQMNGVEEIESDSKSKSEEVSKSTHISVEESECCGGKSLRTDSVEHEKVDRKNEEKYDDDDADDGSNKSVTFDEVEAEAELGDVIDPELEPTIENENVVQPPAMEPTSTSSRVKGRGIYSCKTSSSSNPCPVSSAALAASVKEVVKQLEKGIPNRKKGSKDLKKRSSENVERGRSLSRSGSRSRNRSQNRIPVIVASRHHPNPGGSRSRSRSRSRNGTRIGVTSPHHVAVVEVHQRKEPLGIKTQKGKYPSPYQCKVFPMEDAPRGTIHPFAVDPLTYRLLDNEYFHSLQKEKHDLMEAVQNYYKECERVHSGAIMSSTDSKSLNEAFQELDEGMRKETFMSWIMKEKNKDLEDAGIEFWNPMSNIFRRAVSTQVSSRASFTTTPDHTIHLVGDVEEGNIRKAALNMYQSLKILQKAIHISDIFCFRDNLPAEMLKEEGFMAFYQPEFKKFMESSNEIEILENVLSFLGSSKECIQNYLSSLAGANMIPGKDAGLKKMKDPTISLDNNNVDAIVDETKPSKSGTQGLNQSEETETDAAAAKTEGEAQGDEEKTLERTPSIEINQIIPLTCPSCHSHIDVEVNAFPRAPLLPRVQTFLEEQKKLTMCTYYNMELPRKNLIQTVMCDGLRYSIQYTTSDPCGPIQGIVKGKSEYLGQPSPLSLDLLLSSIQRCTSYIDTRLACACVWARQSKRHLLSVIEKYLAKECKPSTSMSRWQVTKAEKRLKKYNVFGGIIRDFCGELGRAVCMIHFCLHKSLRLLDKKLRAPVLPGFKSCQQAQKESSGSRWRLSEDLEDNNNRPSTKFFMQEQEAVLESIETLYDKMKKKMSSIEFEDLNADLEGVEGQEYEELVSVEALMKIVALAVKDIANVSRLGKEYTDSVKTPGKDGKRALRFFTAAANQLGCAKEIELGSLIATFLSAVEKLNLFEEFMCEQKVDIRSSIHKMCMKIMKKLGDLKGDLWMQKSWTKNLAKNAYLKLKEISEVKRLKKLKKNKREIEEEIEMMRESDESLRLAVY